LTGWEKKNDCDNQSRSWGSGKNLWLVLADITAFNFFSSLPHFNRRLNKNGEKQNGLKGKHGESEKGKLVNGHQEETADNTNHAKGYNPRAFNPRKQKPKRIGREETYERACVRDKAERERTSGA